MSDFTICLILLGFSFLCGTALTWLAVKMSHALGILDMPDARKAHARPTAYLGGFGFTVTVLCGIGLFGFLSPEAAFLQENLILWTVLGLLAVFLLGLWDDVAGTPALLKLGAQLGIAAVLWFAGVRVERLTVGLGEPLTLMNVAAETPWEMLLGGLPSLLVTLIWYAVMMNAINLIDGLDGLAGGVSFIGAMALTAVALLIPPAGVTLGVALPAVVAGACLGFLVHNWPPAKIFLGDSGSLTIGYTLATASLLTSTKAPALLALLIPVVALGLPVFETAFSFFRRAIKGGNPFRADRRHLHHRLLDAGLDSRRVVFVFWYATMYFGVNAVLLARGESALLLLNVVLLGIGLLMVIEYLRFFERRRGASGATSGAAPPAETPRRSKNP